MKRRIMLVAGLTALAACDDPQSVDRGPSDLFVHVYVERDDSLGMHETDTPLRAIVTVQGEESPFVEASDSTGVDGIALFEQLPGGRYTVSHDPVDLPTGLERWGSDRQTVVAPHNGTDTTRFVYRDATPVDTASAPE